MVCMYIKKITIIKLNRDIYLWTIKLLIYIAKLYIKNIVFERKQRKNKIS